MRKTNRNIRGNLLQNIVKFTVRSSYLPPHENIVRVLQILVVKIVRVECLCILVEGLELALDTKNVYRIGQNKSV